MVLENLHLRILIQKWVFAFSIFQHSDFRQKIFSVNTKQLPRCMFVHMYTCSWGKKVYFRKKKKWLLRLCPICCPSTRHLFGYPGCSSVSTVFLSSSVTDLIKSFILSPPPLSLYVTSPQSVTASLFVFSVSTPQPLSLLLPLSLFLSVISYSLFCLYPSAPVSLHLSLPLYLSVISYYLFCLYSSSTVSSVSLFL